MAVGSRVTARLVLVLAGFVAHLRRRRNRRVVTGWDRSRRQRLTVFVKEDLGLGGSLLCEQQRLRLGLFLGEEILDVHRQALLLMVVALAASLAASGTTTLVALTVKTAAIFHRGRRLRRLFRQGEVSRMQQAGPWRPRPLGCRQERRS